MVSCARQVCSLSLLTILSRQDDPPIPHNTITYQISTSLHLTSPHLTSPHLTLLTSLTVNYWDDNRHRRKFFEDFAALKQFSTRQAKHWYQYEPADLEEAFPKEGKALFSRFAWPEVLIKAFPEVRFDHTQFKVLTSVSVDYSEPRNQKEFFGIFSNLSLLYLLLSFLPL